MKTPDTIAQECALEVAITCDKFSERDGCRIVDRLSPIIATAIREATEHEFAAINAERAEARELRKEMIKAQDEAAQLRAALSEAEGALKWWQELKRESRGVAGYHMNGDVAEWDDLNDPTGAALAHIADRKCQP